METLISTEKDRDNNQTTTANSKIIKVNFGEEEESGSLKKRRVKKAKADTIENERRKAEEKLQRRLRRAQEKKKSEPKSFAGFTDLEGEILHINVTKVVKKLGIAIDGGANTKQKAVIIREISVSMPYQDLKGHRVQASISSTLFHQLYQTGS